VQDLPVERQNIAINKRIEEVESRRGDATQSRELLATPFEQRKIRNIARSSLSKLAYIARGDLTTTG